MGVGMVEGWRGEIVCVLTTAGDGTLSAVKVVDPSLHNWFGLAKSMRNQQISDFPICNKSFNLSYAGHDL
jgi:Ni,Fe-hydrogenase III large subunit